MANQTLSHKASLTFLSGLLQQSSRFLVGFLVTPIVIRGLGAELYGAYQMIRQTVGYLSLSDMRPMGTLKFTLAVRQHVEDVGEKRRQIGSALLLWAFSFPLFIAIGIIAIWLSPYLIHTAPDYYSAVRIALCIVFFGVALDRIVSLPGNVLRGMNLDYKGMGLNALTILIGGVFSLGAIWTGLGLPGVAGASVVGVAITGGARFLVAKKSLSWFGPSKPTRNEFFYFTKLSGWFFLYGLSNIMLSYSDLILIGYFLRPSAAAVYTATGLVLRMTTDPLATLLSSGGPGISGLCGEGAWHRILKARTDMYIFAMFGMALIGSGIIALNADFLFLWVSDGYFAGNITNILLVEVAFLKMLFRIDIVIVTGLLELRKQAISTLVSGITVIIIGGFLCRNFGMKGMAVGSFIGYIIQCAYLQVIISNHMRISFVPFWKSLFRLLLTIIFLQIVSYFLSKYYKLDSWFLFLVHSIILAMIIIFILYLIGLNKVQRSTINERLYSFIKILPLAI